MTNAERAREWLGTPASTYRHKPHTAHDWTNTADCEPCVEALAALLDAVEREAETRNHADIIQAMEMRDSALAQVAALHGALHDAANMWPAIADKYGDLLEDSGATARAHDERIRAEERERLVRLGEHVRYCDMAGSEVEFRCERCMEWDAAIRARGGKA